MLRWIILVVVVITITVAATILTQYGPNSETGPSTSLAVIEAVGPQPKLDMQETLTHDFGTMSQQDKGTHAWLVKNVGDADLEMKMLSSTCSCTIAKLRTATGQAKSVMIKPGESTTIDLEWETRNNENEYHKSATIGTNDPARSFTLHVKGKVFPPVIVYPPEMIKLSGISNEEVNRAFVAVFSMDRPETKVKKVTTSRPDFFTAKPRPLSESERKQLRVPGGTHIEVEVKPGLPLGRFHEELVIETDHPRQPEVKVSVTGNTTGPISLIPERVRATDVLGSEGKTLYLTALVRGGGLTKFQVAKKPDKVNVTVEANESDAKKGRYRVTVAVPPGTAAGLVEDEIILKTDNPQASELKIPVTIVISNVAPG